MFNVGDEFLYYGNDKERHGETGTITDIYRPYSTHTNEIEYVCIVHWSYSPLYLVSRKMKLLHSGTPDWEV